jgi:hypothetical protein
MVTEVLVWAMIVTNPEAGRGSNVVVEVYNNELLCRQDMREAARAVPEAKLKCVPKYSMQRPAYGGRAQE